MEILVAAALGETHGHIRWNNRQADCTLGRTGIRCDKREGDGATPMGVFPFRRLLYRPDRIATPRTGLVTAVIAPDDGWCDDPSHPRYNQPIPLPSPAHHEVMWRDDGLYDLVMVIGHNDDPVIPGRGSAVFIHVAKPNLAPTEGCIGLPRHDLLALAEDCLPGDRLLIGLT